MARRIGLLAIAACFSASILAVTSGANDAGAQSYPSKRISWITFGGKGGGGDRWSRILASTGEEHFGQPWRVENITGASGVTAWKELLDRPADGHTIFLSSPSTDIAVLKQPKPPLDVRKDIRIVGYIAAWGSIMLSKPDQEWSTWQGFKAYAEKNPGKITIGGSESVNMGIAYMLKQAGIRDKVTFVPYSSTNDAVADFLGGHVTAMGSTSSTAKTLVPKDAVVVANTGSLPEIKDAPTAKDLGYDGMIFPRWVGVHPKTPDAVVADISKRLGALLNDKSVKRLISRIGETIAFLPHDKAAADYAKMVDGLEDLLSEQK